MNKPLRIVHLNASSAGGAYVAAQRLSDALNQLDGVVSNHLVFEGQLGSHKIWANNWLRKKWAFFLHALEKLDFLRFEKSKSIRFAFSHAFTGVDILKHPEVQNADVVNLHWVNKGFLSFESLMNLVGSGKKIVWTCHDVWPFTGGCYHPRGCNHFTQGCGNCHYLKKPGSDDLSSWVFKRKQSIWGQGQIEFITPSRWLSDTAIHSSMLQCPSEKITVIPNGVDVNFFRVPNSTEREASRKAFGIVEDDFVLMFSAANLTNRAKGFIEFLEVCNKLVESRIKVRAVVIGEKRDQEFTTSVQLDFLGFVSDSAKLRSAYWATDMYVTTSHEENLPTTIMESLSCGVPVSAFSVGGIPEMILSGETGILVDPLNTLEMVDKIQQFIYIHKESMEKIRMNCENFAKSHYADTVIAKEYCKIYLK
jgi:glycosyltransferase involved in cell wall biosynthesis